MKYTKVGSLCSCSQGEYSFSDCDSEDPYHETS